MNTAPDKPCCSICDRRKVCHVCGNQTLYACSDCQIDFRVAIYVCPTPSCRDAHEAKQATIRETILAAYADYEAAAAVAS